MPADPPNKGPKAPEHGSDLDFDVEHVTHVPRRYKVIFHNDDFTTMEFVIEVLRHFFQKSEAEAAHIMLTVHKKGSAVAGVYTRDVAESKVSNVMEHAKECGMPLLVTAEPE